MGESQYPLHRSRKHPPDEPGDKKLLRQTASTLLMLRFSTWRTLQQSRGTYKEWQMFWKLNKDDFDNINHDGAFKSVPLKMRVDEYVRTLSDEDLDRIVSQPIKSEWYRYGIYLQTGACETAKEDIEARLGVHDEIFWDAQESTREGLRDIVDISQTLYTHVQKAAASGCLKKHIEFLKEQLQGMDEGIEDACSYLDIPHQPLVFPDGASQRKIPNSPSNDPPNATIETSKARSALAFLVPVICALSAIPACFAWTHAEDKPGRVTDSDFLQLLASTPIQLLGIFTALWPIINNFRPHRAAWIKSWTLAIISACFTIAAVPLYLLGSASWSGMSLLAGSFMQAFLQLQLILGIPRHKVHED